MRLTPFAAIAAACVLTLTACGDDPTSSDAPTGATESDVLPQVDEEVSAAAESVCSALDPAEVGELLGGEVEGAPPTPVGCAFTGSTGKRTAQLSVAQLSAAGGMEQVEQNLTTMTSGNIDKVPELGDQAFAGASDSEGGAVGVGAVVDGDILYQVTVFLGPKGKPKAATDATLGLLELVDAAL